MFRLADLAGVSGCWVRREAREDGPKKKSQGPLVRRAGVGWSGQCDGEATRRFVCGATGRRFDFWGVETMVRKGQGRFCMR